MKEDIALTPEILVNNSSSTSEVNFSQDRSEDSSQTPKKRNNKPGEIDHSARIDVRSKTQLRKLTAIVKVHFAKEMKGKGKNDRFFKTLKEKLSESFVGPENKALFFRVYSPICMMILKSKTTENVKQSSEFTEEEKLIIMDEIKKYKAIRDKLSIAGNRRELYKHPIVSLANRLIEKNEIYKTAFMSKIEKTRKKEIRDKKRYETLLDSDRKRIPVLV